MIFSPLRITAIAGPRAVMVIRFHSPGFFIGLLLGAIMS